MNKLDPFWITGFTDGEWIFYIWINKNNEMSAWFQVLPEFRIIQHKKDIQLLYKIKNFFWCGVVRVNHDDRYELRIRDLSHLSKIIVPFFVKHWLQTKKKLDFLLFRKVILMMENKEHLNKEWIANILKVAKKMNRQDKSITENNFG